MAVFLSLDQLTVLASSTLPLSAIGVRALSMAWVKASCTVPTGLMLCCPSVTFWLLTLTAATVGAASVLKLKPLLTLRPEVFWASLMLT